MFYNDARIGMMQGDLHKADDEDGSWITINGARVHLNSEGRADKGPKAIVARENNSRYFDSGPKGERDYEDAGSRDLPDKPDAIQSAIARHEADIKRTSALRFSLRSKKEAEFRSAHGRGPNRSELNSILSAINRQVGM
jgi:hypothetical protein